MPDVRDIALCRAHAYMSLSLMNAKGSNDRNKYAKLAMKDLDAFLRTENTSLASLQMKVETLASIDPMAAVHTAQKAIAIHEKGKCEHERYNHLANETQKAKAERDFSKCKEEIFQFKEFLNSKPCFGFKLHMAYAYGNLEKWKDACEVYRNLFERMDECKPEQQVQAYIGLSRCFYHIGDYDHAIKVGGAAIRMVRNYHGVHKYVALAQRVKKLMPQGGLCIEQLPTKVHTEIIALNKTRNSWTNYECTGLTFQLLSIMMFAFMRIPPYACHLHVLIDTSIIFQSLGRSNLANYLYYCITFIRLSLVLQHLRSKYTVSDSVFSQAHSDFAKSASRKTIQNETYYSK